MRTDTSEATSRNVPIAPSLTQMLPLYRLTTWWESYVFLRAGERGKNRPSLPGEFWKAELFFLLDIFWEMDVNLWSCEVRGLCGGWHGGIFLVEIPKNGEDVCYSTAGKTLLSVSSHCSGRHVSTSAIILMYSLSEFVDFLFLLPNFFLHILITPMVCLTVNLA